MKEGFPIHDDLVRTLLYNTEDEEDVADIVMYAVGNTRQDCGEMRLVLTDGTRVTKCYMTCFVLCA